MLSKWVASVTLFVTVFAPTQSFFNFNNPFRSLTGVVKNEETQIKTDVLDHVRQMEMKNPFSSMLLQGHPLLKKRSDFDVNRKLSLTNPFNWTSCGPADQLLQIKSLYVSPSPLALPGQITFGFDLAFRKTILRTDRVEADVLLELRNSPSSAWIKIPCLGVFGSCTYNDLCSLLSGVTCPSDITQAGIRCNCPFYKGDYKLKKYQVEVDASVFLPGEYRAVANITSSNKGFVGCYKIAFSVQ